VTDGSARNPRIIYAVPPKLFDRTARTAMLHTRFPGAPADKTFHCHLMFRFVAQSQRADQYPRLLRFVKETQAKAEGGDAGEQLLYGMLLAGYPQLRAKSTDALPWFLKSAQAGSRDAQYEVGSSLLFGWGCRCENNKGEEWLRRAAESDQASAQVRLAEFALRNASDPQNVRLAARWLERAAARGDHDAMFYLAALLATTSEAESATAKRALDLEKIKVD
jgi:TPR repeat protein